MTELRLYGGQDILYERIKKFLQEKLFNQKVDLENQKQVDIFFRKTNLNMFFSEPK